MMSLRNIGLTAVVAFLTALFCTDVVSTGGSSEQGNSRVIGHIVAPSGSGPIELTLVPEGYTPWMMHETSLFYRTTADENGNYAFDNVDTGSYYLNARNGVSNLRILRGPFSLADSEEQLGNDTLVSVAHLTAAITPTTGDSIVGLYVKGTTDVVPVQGTNVTVAMPSVPAGEVTIMALVRSSPEPVYSSKIFCASVKTPSGDTVNVGYRNLPPTITTRLEDLCSWFYPGILYTDTITAYDPEGSSVRFTVYRGGAPDNTFLIDSTTGIITWVPDDRLFMYGESSIVTIAATDTQGAYSTIGWHIAKATQTIPPASPAGAIQCKPDTLYAYALDSIVCTSSTGQFRFAWGDGDTSAWSTDSIEKHFWRDNGTYEVRVQAHCPEDHMPSEWSMGLFVQVTGEHSTDSLVRLIAPSKVNVFDTVHVSANAIACPGARYRFYLNETAISAWSETPSTTFVAAQRGLYQLSVSVLCDSLRGRVISSPPVKLIVMGIEPYGTCTPQPAASAYTSYGIQSVEIDMSESLCSDFGIDCQYRYVIQNLATGRVVIDTSDWFALDDYLQANEVSSTRGIGIRAQVRCMQDTGYAESEWSPVDSIR